MFVVSPGGHKSESNCGDVGCLRGCAVVPRRGVAGPFAGVGCSVGSVGVSA